MWRISGKLEGIPYVIVLFINCGRGKIRTCDPPVPTGVLPDCAKPRLYECLDQLSRSFKKDKAVKELPSDEIRRRS